MTFNQIKYHLEERACNVDHLEEIAYLASNCITGDRCVIEHLGTYSDVALCHYFYELSVEPPHALIDAYEGYQKMRDQVKSITIKEEDE